jgi:glycosyltransferase involved in cell wall biosynthesis
MPKVSVIVPNYNHALYLQQRIDSILNQTYSNFELIILDDCSTDNSKEIIEQYRNHPKVSQIIYNTQNSGSTFKQWNKGVELAKGEYVWIAESDDVAELHFLDTLIPRLANENVSIAYCQSNRMSSEGMIVGSWLNFTDDLEPGLFQTNFQMKGTDFIKKYLLHKNVIPNASAVVFRKSAFYQVGKADTSVEKCADWLLWLKILVKGNVYFFHESLNNFRFHAKSVIAQAKLLPTFQISEYENTMRIEFENFLKKDNHLKINAFLVKQNYQAILDNKIRSCYHLYHQEGSMLSRWQHIIQYVRCLIKQRVFLKWVIRKLMRVR